MGMWSHHRRDAETTEATLAREERTFRWRSPKA